MLLIKRTPRDQGCSKRTPRDQGTAQPTQHFVQKVKADPERPGRKADPERPGNKAVFSVASDSGRFGVPLIPSSTSSTKYHKPPTATNYTNYTAAWRCGLAQGDQRRGAPRQGASASSACRLRGPTRGRVAGSASADAQALASRLAGPPPKIQPRTDHGETRVTLRSIPLVEKPR